MKEKRQVNRFKDVMWDYYLTNKAISREYEEANKGEKFRKFNRREKSYVVVLGVCLLLLALKFLIF